MTDAAARRGLLSRDTPAEIERQQIEIWRALTPAEVVQIVSGACDAARLLAFAGLRERFPGEPDAALLRRYVELTAGPALARQAYGDDEP